MLSISCRRVSVHGHWLRQRCRRLDAVQPTATQRRQVHVVCNGSSPASSTRQWSNKGSFTVTPSSTVRDLSGYIDPIWSVDAGSCHQQIARFTMLRCSTPAAYHPAADTNCSVPLAYCCTRPFSVGLLQQRSVWTSCQPHPASAVRRSEHITPAQAALISLHWLRVPEPEHISIELPVLTYRSVHGTSVHLVTHSRVSPVSPTWH